MSRTRIAGCLPRPACARCCGCSPQRPNPTRSWSSRGSRAVPAPGAETFARGVERLPGAHAIVLRGRSRHDRGAGGGRVYREPLRASRAELTEQLRASLGDAVRSRMRPRREHWSHPQRRLRLLRGGGGGGNRASGARAAAHLFGGVSRRSGRSTSPLESATSSLGARPARAIASTPRPGDSPPRPGVPARLGNSVRRARAICSNARCSSAPHMTGSSESSTVKAAMSCSASARTSSPIEFVAASFARRFGSLPACRTSAGLPSRRALRSCVREYVVRPSLPAGLERRVRRRGDAARHLPAWLRRDQLDLLPGGGHAVWRGSRPAPGRCGGAIASIC